jgi:hypothetical protein
MSLPPQSLPMPRPRHDPLVTAVWEPQAAPSTPPSRASFWVGSILILLSFGIYPAYPLVSFLPISVWQKGGVGVVLAGASWAMFFAGSALVGKKGVTYLKRRLLSQRVAA